MGMNTATLRRTVADTVSLIKPRITLLTLCTTLTGAWLAAGGGLVGMALLVPLVLGTGLGVSSACLLNNYFDRFIDQRMSRTRDRPLPAGRVRAVYALAAAIVTGASGVSILAWGVHPICAGLLLVSILNYGFVYTLWLKRETPYSTEIVGVSGALAPVIGWVAVTGEPSAGAYGLFTVLFLWQPSHFWALGLLYRDDYVEAELPRYPVVHGPERTQKRLLAYTTLLVLVAVGLGTAPSFGGIYLAGSTVLGGWYLYMTVRFLCSDVTRRTTLTLFFSSIIYLVGLLLLLVVCAAV